MTYTPPPGNAVNLTVRTGYTPPSGTSVNLVINIGGVSESILDTLTPSDTARAGISARQADIIAPQNPSHSSPTHITYDAASLSDTVGIILSRVLYSSDSTVLADTSSGAAFSRVASVAGVTEQTIITTAGVLSDFNALVGSISIVASRAQSIRDTLTFTELITRLGAVIQLLTDTVTISEIEKIKALAELTDALTEIEYLTPSVKVQLKELVGFLEALNVLLSSLHTDTLLINSSMTTLAQKGVQVETVIDALSVVDTTISDLLAFYLSKLSLLDVPASSTKTQTEEAITTLEATTITVVTKALDNLGVAPELTTAPRLIVKELLPLLDKLLAKSEGVITRLYELLRVNTKITGQPLTSLSEGLTTSDSLQAVWFYISAIALRLISRIAVLLALESALNSIEAHRSVITSALSLGSTPARSGEVKSLITQLKYLQGR